MNGDIKNLRLVLNASVEEWRIVANYLRIGVYNGPADKNIINQFAITIFNACNSTVTKES